MYHQYNNISRVVFFYLSNNPQIYLSRTLIGAEVDKEEKICVGHLFFDPAKLATNENDLLKVRVM